MACDQCFRCKVRCSGDKPSCERCRTSSSFCTYSTGKPLGKPKGSRNRTQGTSNKMHDRRSSTTSTATRSETCNEPGSKNGSSSGSQTRIVDQAQLLLAAEAPISLNTADADSIPPMQRPVRDCTVGNYDAISDLTTTRPVPHDPRLPSHGTNRVERCELQLSAVSAHHRTAMATFNSDHEKPFVRSDLAMDDGVLSSIGLDFDEGFLEFGTPPSSLTSGATTEDCTAQHDLSKLHSSLASTDSTIPTSRSGSTMAISPSDLLSLPDSSRVTSLLLDASNPGSNLTIDNYLVRAHEALHLIQVCLGCDDINGFTQSSLRDSTSIWCWSVPLLICCQLLQRVTHIYMRLLRQLSLSSGVLDFSGSLLQIGDFVMPSELQRNVFEMIIKRGLSDCRATLRSLETRQQSIASSGVEKEVQLVFPYLEALAASLATDR